MSSESGNLADFPAAVIGEYKTGKFGNSGKTLRPEKTLILTISWMHWMWSDVQNFFYVLGCSPQANDEQPLIRRMRGDRINLDQLKNCDSIGAGRNGWTCEGSVACPPA
jgi:hypothetical protein